MSESKFTPGPWAVEEYNADYVQSQGRASTKRICIFAGAFEVARATGEDWDTRQANARLIAATPNLLAACRCERDDGMDGNILREAAETLRSRGCERMADRLERKADAEDAAIALATKEQPCGSSPN